LLVRVYARVIFSLFMFSLRSTYKQPRAISFSADKHTRMTKLKGKAERVFNLMVGIVGEKTKYDYSIPFDYEGCKLLIRPFIFSEIIMVSGLWEPYVKPILDKEVKNTHTVVDVGANIGVYAIPLAKRVSKVIAFEPNPKTSEILKKSIALNQIRNIVLIQKAVGDTKKAILFGLSAIPMQSGVITGPTTDAESSIETECIDLDTALATENRVDWLLIDIEGFEVSALKGARKILQRFSPKIIIEVFNENVNLVKKILTNEGYTITHLYLAPSSASYYYAVKK